MMQKQLSEFVLLLSLSDGVLSLPQLHVRVEEETQLFTFDGMPAKAYDDVDSRTADCSVCPKVG